MAHLQKPHSIYVSLPHPPTSPLFPYTTLFRSLSHNPSQPLYLLNIAGGPGIDSLNALILLQREQPGLLGGRRSTVDRKSTRLNSSHGYISYAAFSLENKTSNRSTKTQAIVSRL